MKTLTCGVAKSYRRLLLHDLTFFFLPGVSHGDEVHLLFYRDYSSIMLTDQDVMFSDELIKRWVNFVDTAYVDETLNF